MQLSFASGIHGVAHASARREQVRAFAEAHGLPCTTVAAVAEFRRRLGFADRAC
jgi:3,4-dihydroxy-2-butanone 4-phosphate synthase